MIGLIEGDDRGKDRFVSCRIEEESPDLFNGGRVLQGQTRFSFLALFFLLKIGRAHV